MWGGLFELGCENGGVAYLPAQFGWDVTGVDPSSGGIDLSHSRYPNLKLYSGSAYDRLPAQYGRFYVLACLEVVDHFYAPRKFATPFFDLVEPDGFITIYMSYHRYTKNLVIALTGQIVSYFAALWDYSHIKL